MSTEQLLTYEKAHEVISDLRRAPKPQVRDVVWFDGRRILGVSRDTEGRVEIFLTGPPLSCASTSVAANITHDVWHTESDKALVANRLLLPREAHFDAVAAFVCVHLVENGLLDELQPGFTRTEPVIALALDRERLRNEIVVGLCGELLFLRAVLRRRPVPTVVVLEGWKGFKASSRDFSWASIGIEVKTTRRSVSRHRVQGIRQVEAGFGHTGLEEARFYLLSIGVEPLPSDASADNAWSLPGLVEEILRLIGSQVDGVSEVEEVSQRFLEQVRLYGGAAGQGYRHEESQHRALYGQMWRTTFVRAYDMADPLVSVIRSIDLTAFTMVVADTVEFEVDLPVQVRGDVNPLVGMKGFLDVVVAEVGDTNGA